MESWEILALAARIRDLAEAHGTEFLFSVRLPEGKEKKTFVAFQGGAPAFKEMLMALFVDHKEVLEEFIVAMLYEGLDPEVLKKAMRTIKKNTINTRPI